MKLTRIITNRAIDPHHANGLLYEWEEDLCQFLSASLYYNKSCQNQRYSKFIPFLLNFVQTSEPAFCFEMCVYRHSGNNKRNIIPCILDYYIHNKWLARFWAMMYWRNPFFCVSSPEVYQFLTEEVGIKKVRLLPQTLSDRYRISAETHFDKKYDVFIAGRQNKVLLEWFNQYAASHPDFTYVRSIRKDGEFRFYDQAGQCISQDDSRETYIRFMRSARACMYSPQGIDGSRQTNGFGQVTPHLLEIIACGCHPLMRYQQNIDTEFFELSSFGPHLANYEQFQEAMDQARVTPVDMQKHSVYLEKHYTSVIAKQLEDYLR